MQYRCYCGESRWCLPVKNVADEQKFQIIRKLFIKYTLEEIQEILSNVE
jgi:hypothetical protein